MLFSSVFEIIHHYHSIFEVCHNKTYTLINVMWGKLPHLPSEVHVKPLIEGAPETAALFAAVGPEALPCCRPANDATACCKSHSNN